MTSKLFDLDTGTVETVSDREFFTRIFGSDEYRAERDRQMHERCIRAIQRGDTYGWPPMMVDHCKKLMALRDADSTVGDPMKSRRAA